MKEELTIIANDKKFYQNFKRLFFENENKKNYFKYIFLNNYKNINILNYKFNIYY